MTDWPLVLFLAGVSVTAAGIAGIAFVGLSMRKRRSRPQRMIL